MREYKVLHQSGNNLKNRKRTLITKVIMWQNNKGGRNGAGSLKTISSIDHLTMTAHIKRASSILCRVHNNIMDGRPS